MCVTVIGASGRVLQGWTSALLEDPWTAACQQVYRRRAVGDQTRGVRALAKVLSCTDAVSHGEAAGLLLCGVALNQLHPVYASGRLVMGASTSGAAPFAFHSRVQNLPSHTRWWAAAPLRLASPKPDRSVDLSLRAGPPARSFLSFCVVA